MLLRNETIDIEFAEVVAQYDTDIQIVITTSRPTSVRYSTVACMYMNPVQLREAYESKQHRRPLAEVIWKLSFEDFVIYVLCHELAHLDLQRYSTVKHFHDGRFFRFESVVDGYALSMLSYFKKQTEYTVA